jgi:diaminobutyrate-2-oxoglutarate transaminase
MRGIHCVNGDIAGKITHLCFKNGLIIETSGADDQVVKFLCPLIISMDNLKKGLDIVENAIREVCAKEDSIPENDCYFDDVQLVKQA